MRQGKTSFLKMRQDLSPFSLVQGGRENPNGPVTSYTLPPHELEEIRNRPYRPPTDINGRKLGKPSSPPGGGGVA